MNKNLPEINVGIVGHIDHGKTTFLSKLTGKFTDTHSEELKRGITIKLGYADMTIYKCLDGFTNKKTKDKNYCRSYKTKFSRFKNSCWRTPCHHYARRNCKIWYI